MQHSNKKIFGTTENQSAKIILIILDKFIKEIREKILIEVRKVAHYSILSLVFQLLADLKISQDTK